MKRTMKLLGGLLAIMTVSIFSSCTEGYEDEAAFESDVRDTQLKSPEIDKSCFSTVSTSTGEKVQLTWPLVKGAGGYKVNVAIAGSNGDEPVITDSIVDGLTVLFDKSEDTRYNVSVQTMGNTKLNNTAAAEASSYLYSTMIDGISIPTGNDVATFINSYIGQHAGEMDAAMKDDPNNYEIAFELEAGKQYTLNDSADMRLYPVTVRSSDKKNPATVTVGAKGYFTTQSGLKIKYLNIDCTNMGGMGLLTLGANPDSTLSVEALGYKALGANQNDFVIQKTVAYQGCNIKNLATGMLWNNAKPWALNDFRINDCIVQMVNETAAPVINLTKAGGSIMAITLQNSSFINLKDNAVQGGYFMRFYNYSSANPKKIWGNGATATCTFSNNTFVKCMTGNNFADQYIRDGSTTTVSMKGNIFYDCWRIQKLIYTNAVDFTAGDNTIWGVSNTVDNTDKEKYATEENPGFAAPTAEMDFTKTNGGYNLKPTGAKAVAGHFGDPRWY